MNIRLNVVLLNRIKSRFLQFVFDYFSGIFLNCLLLFAYILSILTTIYTKECLLWF